MPKIRIHNTPEDRAMLNAEIEATRENRHRRVVESIHKRTMTRDNYYATNRRLREFVFRVKHELFGKGLICLTQ